MATGSTIGAVAPTVARRSGAALPEMLKDSALFALVTLGLSIPVVAYRTDLGQGTGLELTGRWGVVAGLCLAVFVLRLGQRLLLGEVARRRRWALRFSTRRWLRVGVKSATRMRADMQAEHSVQDGR